MSQTIEGPGGNNALLQVRGVHKSYGILEVLKGVDLQVQPGETVVVLGRSGSGKSTLLRCINCLETIQAGSITVGGQLMGYRWKRGRLHHASDRRIARQRQQIGMVFQHFNLFPHMTALQNLVEAPSGVLNRNKAEVTREAHALLDRVGLGDKGAAYPRHLSGGQQQRVAIARALAMQPPLMLFDEPTSALDPELVGDVLATMRDLAGEGLTMVVVTHEVGFAREVADHVVFMHDGLVVESGPTADILERPQDPRTREFLSKVPHLTLATDQPGGRRCSPSAACPSRPLTGSVGENGLNSPSTYTSGCTGALHVRSYADTWYLLVAPRLNPVTPMTPRTSAPG